MSTPDGDHGADSDRDACGSENVDKDKNIIQSCTDTVPCAKTRLRGEGAKSLRVGFQFLSSFLSVGGEALQDTGNSKNIA